MSELKIHNMTTIGYLSRMEYLLRNVGWCKGMEHNRNEDGVVTAYCLSGALNEATRDGDYNSIAHTQICTVLNDLAPSRDFVNFNDAKETTLEDIIGLIHQAEAYILTGPKTPPNDDPAFGDEDADEDADEDDSDSETDDESQIETNPDRSHDLQTRVLEHA